MPLQGLQLDFCMHKKDNGVDYKDVSTQSYLIECSPKREVSIGQQQGLVRCAEHMGQHRKLNVVADPHPASGSACHMVSHSYPSCPPHLGIPSLTMLCLLCSYMLPSQPSTVALTALQLMHWCLFFCKTQPAARLQEMSCNCCDWLVDLVSLLRLE